MSKPAQDKNLNIPDFILKDLLTPSEIRMLKNRWQIMNLLNNGQTIRSVAEEVGVGTDTVVRTARLIEKNNLKLEDKKIAKSNTPWIFGKNEK